MEGYDPTREPIQAYLRLRPPSNSSQAKTSYVEILSDTEVLMVPPADHRLNPSTSTIFGVAPIPRTPSPLFDLPSSSGSQTAPFGALYKFTKVFPSFPAPTQADFFTSTTLPLVHDFLNGENCLLFAYGPTGSGKTWTVQGDEGVNAGLLPRVMDVVWRSLEGKEGKSNMRPIKLSGFEPQPTTSTPQKGKPFAAPGLGMRQSHLGPMAPAIPVGDLPPVVKVDDLFEYSIWVSYAEIYNEKIYDLLEAPLPTPSLSTSSTTGHTMLGLFSAGGAKAKAMFKGVSTVKRNALSLKQDKTVAGGGTGTKYVAGMKEVRVHSAEEARAILDRGQQNRRVFSTLANRVSSRSHSVFTIKVIRVLKGADDMAATSTSRFSIVDLAGSERVVNTQTTGDRLKEAGNINKSLMVLGQCMEVLRKNQERGEGRKPAIVPFRHSKLTELFQSFFVGDGKAAMIVNVNPYETGFDENSHVMKFSAVAKGVMTMKDSTSIPVLATPLKAKEPRLVRVSMVEGGEEQDVFYEEDEDIDEGSEEDALVTALVEELSSTRTALFEARMNAAMVASTVRSQTIAEYEAKLVEMEEHYRERLRSEALEAEEKMNVKLDILTKLQALKDAATDVHRGGYADNSDEEEVSSSEGENTEEKVEELLLHGQSCVEVDNGPASQASSPILAGLHNFSLLALQNELDSPVPAPKLAPLMLVDDGDDSLTQNSTFEQEHNNQAPVKEETSAAIRVSTAKGRRVVTAKKTTDIKTQLQEDFDDLGFDQSIVIPALGKVTKPKRKLGDIKVKDVDELEELYAPNPSMTKTSSHKSLANKTPSHR